MGVKVATPWSSSRPIIPQSKTLPAGNLRRARSFHRPSRSHTIIRSCSASLDPSSSSSSSSSFSPFSFDEDFSRQIHDLAFVTAMDPSLLVPPAPPEWHGRAGEETVIQRKANSVEIPLSLRIIKRKLKWEENLTEAGESAYCSMKKAFSSMVFIVRELHSYSLLQMRDAISSTRGDLQSTLARVHCELHASFVWLFQSVFSHTPALMVSVMILLANFTVYSMDSHLSTAAPPLPIAQVQIAADAKYFDPSPSSRLTVSLDGSNVAFVSGDGGRGGSSQPMTSGTEGDGVGSAESRPASSREDEEASEARLWDEIVDEARRMEVSARGVFLDPETVKWFVSPVTARIEADDVADYFRTELVYQVGLTQDPNNPLLLANYAQFLYLVAQDYDRAEEYFKRAIKVEPKDAEAFSKYASFLWMARKDLWAAEETFLEAISADPNNSFYAANYAHFLWNTGGEDTCFPLDSSDQDG